MYNFQHKSCLVKKNSKPRQCANTVNPNLTTLCSLIQRPGVRASCGGVKGELPAALVDGLLLEDLLLDDLP